MNSQQTFSTQFDPANFERESSDFCRSMAESAPRKTQGFGIFQTVNSRKSQQEQDRGVPVPASPTISISEILGYQTWLLLPYVPVNYRLFSHNIKPRDHKKEFGEANLLVFWTKAAQNCQTYPSSHSPSFVLLLLWISPGPASPGGCSGAYQPQNTWRAPVPAPWPFAGSSPTVLRGRNMFPWCPRVWPGPASAQLWPEIPEKKLDLYFRINQLE